VSMTKDPNARLDFAVDWSAWLPSGDSITSSLWLAPEDLATDTPSINGATTIVWISGGVAGRTYQVTNRVTTAAGRVDDRTLRITITNR
jgi:hypothetical protein